MKYTLGILLMILSLNVFAYTMPVYNADGSVTMVETNGGIIEQTYGTSGSSPYDCGGSRCPGY